MRILPWFATAVVAVSLTACNSNKSAENPSGSSGGGLLSRASNMVGGVDAFSAFMRANAAKEKATSYRMKMEMNAQGQGMSSLTEVQCPDKYHQTTDFMGRKMEQYHIGSTMYMNTGGAWKSISAHTPYDCHGHIASSGSSAPAHTSSGGSKDPSDNAAQQIEKAKDEYTFTKGDVVTVEGDPCQQYTVTSKNPNETKMKSMTFCVGTKDDLLRQMKTEGMTMTYYDWNKDLGIKAPI
jgi:hypothetical protein